MIDPAILVRDAAAESAELEFKMLLPDRSDRGKHEFLKDVCAFANSGGGTIYFGVAEKNGTATSIAPIQGESFDDAARRLGQILDAGIEPRLPPMEVQQFACDGGYTLGVRVPPSLGTPHRYLFNGHSKFVRRNNTHVAEMNYEQVRSAFNRNGALVERVERQWEAEIERASQRKTWRPIEDGPICVVQFVPLQSLEISQLVDVQQLYDDYVRFMFSDWGGASASFNLDGLVVHTGDTSGAVRAFVQVKRNGVIQAFRSAAVAYRDEAIIPSQTVAAFIRQAVFKFTEFLGSSGISGPYILNIALLGVAGYRLGIDERLMIFDPAVADRGDLILPQYYIETLTDLDGENIVREALDVLWQAFGMARCNLYSTEGVWAPR